MAFFGRIGNLLRNAANKQISSELRSSPSIFQAIRCMSSAPSSKLFIGGVSYSTDEQSLREAFSRYGEVVDARIIVDRDSGRSRGFGFVTFSSAEEASSAIQALDGQDLHGRRIRVNYANERPRFGGGGGSFGGSYGNAPYGAGGGAGYGGAYSNAPYGGASGGGYGGNAAGGYSGGGYGSGASYGHSGFDNNYSAPDSFGSSSAEGSGGYGGNSGNYGVAGGVGGSDSYGNAPGFDAAAGVGSHETSAGFGGSAGGFDGSEGSGNGNSGQPDNEETSNDSGDLDSVEGNYRDDNDDTDNFAKRA
ncbi:hypothetical protein PIB30_015598 [Stylosanthes scabra]|uniref:RRM domain-containing protein n=1 Tax=Stylosanthes scabra TaxID=79078 RepID=A0ABU6R7C0_9FABA|nr:hypothetical protein [Stylosanthes scabra]